jgi:hypothetical protein
LISGGTIAVLAVGEPFEGQAMLREYPVFGRRHVFLRRAG